MFTIYHMSVSWGFQLAWGRGAACPTSFGRSSGQPRCAWNGAAERPLRTLLAHLLPSLRWGSGLIPLPDGTGQVSQVRNHPRKWCDRRKTANNPHGTHKVTASLGRGLCPPGEPRPREGGSCWGRVVPTPAVTSKAPSQAHGGSSPQHSLFPSGWTSETTTLFARSSRPPGHGAV